MISEKTNAFGISTGKLVNEDIALIVIDLQNYSINPKWKLINNLFSGSDVRVQLYSDYYERLNLEVIPNIMKLINIFKEKLKKIFFIKYENSLPKFEDLSESHKLIWNELKNKTGMSYEPGGEAFEIINEVKKLISTEDIILKKITNGLFASTNIDMILRNLNIKSLIICGAWTNCCVETSIREAFDRGYLVFLPEDACIAPGKSFHEAALLNLGNFYCNVCTTESIISEIKKYNE